jgi:hypothetical protein
MTNIFIGRVELLPPGETLEEHKKLQTEEAEAVQQDKDNTDTRTGGLFKGCFKPHALHARGPSLQVLRDQEDGVDRCPVCTWELEDGGCQQCGLIFDESGEVSWGDSFTGFSDMDEMSEHDTEELDGEMEMEDVDYENWENYMPDQGSFMMRRFLEGGIPPQAAAFALRRHLTHSEAGSRRSYSQSIVSDRYNDEMHTVEEEDEEDPEEEDSEMNDFIDDEDIEGSTSAASSTPGPPVQPPVNRARAQGRARRIVESETSSTISSVIEEEDEDEEDEGPIRRGQRNPAQSRVLNRANGSRSSRDAPSSRGAPSSTSTDVSTEDLDEDTQALLREEGWGMLQHDDDEMGEDEDEDEDSDGGRTTVGWEPLANSIDRSRMGGSLTPTADRPRPSAPIRPPSRAGNIHLMNAARGLRRRSSVLSTSSVHYEDGEADDDDSDQEGDVTSRAMNTLRNRRSQAQMRTMAAFANSHGRFGSRTPVQGAGHDLDVDDTSDTSQPGHGQRGLRTQRREYDPRISWMFAAHQQALQEHQMTGALIDVEPRSITPLARPRTANRNRPSPAQAYSPFLPPSRLRTPLMDNTSNLGPGLRMPVSPPRRNAMSPVSPLMGSGTSGRTDRAPSISSTNTGSVILTPGTSTPDSQYSIDSIVRTQTEATMDMIDRPESRVSGRPTSAAGRRASSNFSPVYPQFHNAGMGLHVQGSALPPYQIRGGNPWAAFVQARGIRNRSSRQVLREQPSTATLRAAGSRVNLRETAAPVQTMRPRPSRVTLRPQPSVRQLGNQASTRTLRASEHGRPPPSPGNGTQASSQPIARPVTLTREERVRELIETRSRALNQPSGPPAATNPFTRRAATSANPQIQQGVSSQHTRTNSNESMQSVNSAGTVNAAPSSPALGRRRSNRSMLNAPPPGVLPPSPGVYAPSVMAYNNNQHRPRQVPSTGTTNGYEAPLNVNVRGMNPIPAGHYT